MNKFVLVDGYVSMDNSKLKLNIDEFKNIKKQLFLLFFFSAYVYDRYKEFVSGEFPKGVYDYFKIALIFFCGILIIYSIYHLFFKKNFKKNIEINEIETIEITEDLGNEYEIEVDLTRDNNRIQRLKFRKLENQLEPFLSELKKRNTRIIIKN